MIDLGNGVQLVTRFEWGARAPRSVTPCSGVQGVTAHWEGPHMGDFPHSSCASKVRGIQNYHMDSQGWTDIAYSALSCPHGYAFEGRGPGVRTAANGTTAGNDGWLAVCYLGGEGDPFTDDAKRAHRAVTDWLDEHGAGPGRNCHRDHKNTACPGDVICSWVRAGLPVESSNGGFLMALTDKEQEDMRLRLIRIEKALANGGFLGSGDDIDADLGLLAQVDRAFVEDRGSDDVRTAFADQLVNIGLERSPVFKALDDKVDAILARLPEG